MRRFERVREVISRLLSRYGGVERTWRGDPFRGLVRTILSQNTGYKNVAMAYDQLEGDIGITPESLAGASIIRITEAVRPAGMHKQRGRILKELAEAILQRFDGDIAPVLERPYDEARDELMSLPGVGQKTADVVLMFHAGRAIIPIDRHIFRISERLQIVPKKASYDQVRAVLEAAAPPERYRDVHILLIRFGREVCKAQRPSCPECFLRDLCPFPSARD